MVSKHLGRFRPSLVRLGRLGAVMATRVQNVQNGQKNVTVRLSPLCSVELKPKTWPNVPPRGFSRTTPPRGPKPTPRSPWARPAARELA